MQATTVNNGLGSVIALYERCYDFVLGNIWVTFCKKLHMDMM